tara:strand:+ start:553 stop:1008 length:456 start_codon:yes stop_codon:yes gene_type:complete
MQITGRITILVLCLTFLPTKFSNAEEKFWSLKNDKVNVRYGHGKGHAIKYVYRKINLPVKQIDKKDNWRRIVDLKNNSGWIHDSQLKKSNSIIILIDKILFKKPSHLSKPIVRLQKGRLLIIKNCEDNWCKITDNNYSGWIKAENIWGSIK